MAAETDIAAVDTGGANTAAEVRTALTSVLTDSIGGTVLVSEARGGSSLSLTAIYADVISTTITIPSEWNTWEMVVQGLLRASNQAGEVADWVYARVHADGTDGDDFITSLPAPVGGNDGIVVVPCEVYVTGSTAGAKTIELHSKTLDGTLVSASQVSRITATAHRLT